MEKLYTEDDVERWKIAYHQAVELHQEMLKTNLPRQKIDFHLSNLAGSSYMLGMAFLASGDIEATNHTFRASVEARCKMYERFERGEGRSLEAGHFQSMLISFVTRDSSLVSRFVGHYQPNDGTLDSVFLGRILKQLGYGDVVAAKSLLNQKKPRFEPRFVGYTECIQAIANKDQQELFRAINFASDNWCRWALKNAQGLPDSVCFIQGVGLIRLAEQILETSIVITNDHIPQALLG